jgi:hypothetical protein
VGPDIVWSLMGRPADGWVERDEENWDHAVEVIEERIVKTKGFYYAENGEPRVRVAGQYCHCCEVIRYNICIQ